MLFYDIDPFGEQPEPKPLTDEEYNQRVETYSTTVADYKERLLRALGQRHARKFVKSMQDFISRDAYTELEFVDWKALLEGISTAICHNYLSAVIRFTPKKYAHDWTAEELDKKVKILGLDEQVRYYTFKEAGLSCQEPESMIRHRLEYEKLEQERQEHRKQWLLGKEARDAEFEKKWAPRLKECEDQLRECEKQINEIRELARTEGIEIA